MKYIKFCVLILVLFCGCFFCGCNKDSHVMSDWAIKTQADCTNYEVLERFCKKCGQTETKMGKAALGHSYTKSTIQPTTNAVGYNLYQCHCGHSYKEDYKCMVTFNSITENDKLLGQVLPTFNPLIVSINTPFTGATATKGLMVKEYRVYGQNGYQTLKINQKISQSMQITIVWDEERDPTPQQIAFNQLISNIEKLEELSEKYNQQNAQIRVMQFIRNARYNTTAWNSVGGTLEADFEEYVRQNQGSLNLFDLQTLTTFVNPVTGAKIDFVHMVYTINAIALNGADNQNIADLAGWGGDICQLVVETVGTSYTGTALQAYVDSKFNSESSSFGSQDVQADLDALNISIIFLAHDNNFLSTAMLQYYNMVTSQNQKSLFKTNALLSSYTTSNTMADAMVTRLSNNPLIGVWCVQNGINTSGNRNEFVCACRALAKHLL